MTEVDLEHLNLRAWPFITVPSVETAAVWVGRPKFARKMRGLLRSVERVAASRVVLLWAAYGAGKTHALRHLELEARGSGQVRALYVITPKGIRSFLDVYRAIIDAALGTDILSELGLALYRSRQLDHPTDLRRALARLVSMPEPQTRTAISWLKADRVSARDLRESRLTHRLETTADGIDTLNELIELLHSELDVKLMLLLDEIQELAQLQGTRHDEAVGGLHKVFDRNTNGLTLVFTFTTTAQSTMAKVIGPTLYERRSEVLTLPPLTHTEAVEFITGLLAEWSIDRERAPYPFTSSAIVELVSALPHEHGYIPRDLIRAFDAVLREADLDIIDGEITEITSDYARARLLESEAGPSEDGR